jgi:hypothetical protein
MFRDLIDEWDPYHPVMLFLLIFPILLAHTEVRIYLFSTKVLFKMKTLSTVTDQCSLPISTKRTITWTQKSTTRRMRLLMHVLP